MSAFHLTKWYLDCVSDTGSVLIGYAALIRWRGLRLPLAGLLTYEGDRTDNRARISFRWRPPVGDAERINWNCRAFDLTGTWRSCSPSLRRTWYGEGENQIKWHCLQPVSLVNVEFGNGRIIGGRGYVERLEMTALPWEAGLRHLQWGRFVSEEESVIWIRWAGDDSKVCLIHNGSDVAGSIDDNGVISERGFDLRLSDSRLLRQGLIGTTVLNSIPLARMVLPRRLATIREAKWLSRGTLMREGRSTVVGWVIHERVSFDG